MGIHDRDYARDDPDDGGGHGLTVVKWLMIANAVVFFLDGILLGSRRGTIFSPVVWGYFSFEKAILDFQIWRLFTYQFLHQGLLHLVFNMIGLYFFGPLMEQYWGRRRFLAFYLLCGAAGAVVMSALATVPGLLNAGLATPLLGASGAVYGILIATATVYPDMRIQLLLPPVPVRMKTFALALLGVIAISLLVGSSNAGGEAAHLGGAALGFLLVRHPALLNVFNRRFAFAAHAPKGFSVLSNTQSPPPRPGAGSTHRPTREDIDRILDKISRHGIHSLSAEERRILEIAREDLK